MEINWNMIVQIATVTGGISAVIAMWLAPILWLGSKIDAFRAEVHQDMKEFRAELKEFHGRLCAVEEGSKK
jgi:hypothetical protein